MNLEDIQKKKSVLVEKLDMLADSWILPVEGITRDKVLDRRKALEDETFIVAVTGQIKAGKSTLINALIFGEPILPYEMSVMTAKNTLITYGKERSFQAEFYSKAEWDALHTELKKGKDLEVYESLVRAIQESSDRGATPTRFITHAGKTVQSADFAELVKYIGPFNLGGTYTPYVRQVTIYEPNPLLKDITFADTPGVNDPNPYRDSITKEWIHNATAVVHVIFAGRAFDATDKEFMQKYLLHAPKEHRIMVVNKIDTIEDRSSIESWLEELRTQDVQNSVLLGDRESIAYVSALGGLLDTMRQNNTPIDDRLREWEELFDYNGFLSPDRHCLGDLERLVASKIFDNKATKVFCGAEEFAQNVLRKALEEVDGQLASAQDRIAASESSQQDIETQLRDIEEVNRRITEYELKLKEDAHRKYHERLSDFEETLADVENAVRRMTKTEINKLSTYEEVVRQGPWEIERLIRYHESQLKRMILIFQTSIEKDLYNLLDTFILDVQLETLSLNSISVLVRVSRSELNDELLKIFSQTFDTEKVQNIVREALIWYQKPLKTLGADANARSMLIAHALEAIRNSFVSYMSVFRVKSKEGVDKAQQKMFTNIRTRTEKIQRELEDIQRNFTELQQNSANLHAEYAQLRERKEAIEKFVQSFNER